MHRPRHQKQSLGLRCLPTTQLLFPSFSKISKTQQERGLKSRLQTSKRKPRPSLLLPTTAPSSFTLMKTHPKTFGRNLRATCNKKTSLPIQLPSFSHNQTFKSRPSEPRPEIRTKMSEEQNQNHPHGKSIERDKITMLTEHWHHSDMQQKMHVQRHLRGMQKIINGLQLHFCGNWPWIAKIFELYGLCTMLTVRCWLGYISERRESACGWGEKEKRIVGMEFVEIGRIWVEWWIENFYRDLHEMFVRLKKRISKFIYGTCICGMWVRGWVGSGVLTRSIPPILESESFLPSHLSFVFISRPWSRFALQGI